jgi:hypothetical protein
MLKKVQAIFIFLNIPLIAFAFRDRPASDGSYFSPLTTFCLIILGIVIAVFGLRFLYEVAKGIDWGKLFGGFFSIICIGAFLWMFVLLIADGKCSSNNSNNTNTSNHSTESNILNVREDDEWTYQTVKCTRCNQTGKILDVERSLRTGRDIMITCPTCNGTLQVTLKNKKPKRR